MLEVVDVQVNLSYNLIAGMVHQIIRAATGALSSYISTLSDWLLISTCSVSAIA